MAEACRDSDEEEEWELLFSPLDFQNDHLSSANPLSQDDISLNIQDDSQEDLVFILYRYSDILKRKPGLAGVQPAGEPKTTSADGGIRIRQVPSSVSTITPAKKGLIGLDQDQGCDEIHDMHMLRKARQEARQHYQSTYYARLDSKLRWLRFWTLEDEDQESVRQKRKAWQNRRYLERPRGCIWDQNERERKRRWVKYLCSSADESDGW